MSPHGIKGTSKKNKCTSLSVNGPKMLAKKKRKILSETPDIDVSTKETSYWRGLKIESSNDLKEKILKQLTCPSRLYKGRDEGVIELPPKKKRKFQKNGSVETDSDVEKTSRKSKLMKQQQYLEKSSSKLQRWKKLAGNAQLYGSSNSSNKGKKNKKQTVNFEDADGVCVYDLQTPSKLKKMKRQKGANHIVNKKKVRIGKCVITPHKGGRKEMMKPKLDVSSSRLKILSKKQRKKLEEIYSLQIYSDLELSDSDVSADGQNVISAKKGKLSMTDNKWGYRQLLSKKKAKPKKEQECSVGKIKKSKQQQEQVLEEEDSYDNIDEPSSDEDISEVDDDDDDDEVEDAEEYEDDDDDEDEDDDDEEDDDEDSEAQMSDERLGVEKKKMSNQNLPNGNWEMINDERCQEVTQEDYGSAWKLHDGDMTSVVLHPWPHGNNFQQQQPHSHQVLQKNKHAGLANSSNLSTVGGVVDSTQSGHSNPGISHPSLQHYQSEQENQQQQFTENHIQMQDGSVQHFSDQTRIYNIYNVDCKPQTHISNSQIDPDQSSQSCHLQQYSDFNHTQSQTNSSFGISKVKYYYPASFGKEGILEVESALQPIPPEEVLTQGFRISIKRCDMATLVGANWLNDEIINFYMNIIVQRSKIDGYPSVYIPSTFFFPMVMKRGYSGVRRWTKNVDIFDHDLMLIPIHLESENHWTLIAVDFLQCSICYYDSYLQDRDDAMDAILNYLREEMKAKKNIEMDTNCWVKVNMKNIPLQENMSDCGVFSCIYAEYISRGDQMDFTQEDMPYFRRKMVYEILNKKLVTHSPRDVENMISDEILEDINSSNENGHILMPDTSTAVIQNGLPDNFQSPTKVSEETLGLAAVSKDMEGIRDVERTQNGSTSGEMEQKASLVSADDESNRKHRTNLISEIKRNANLFDDANEEERNLLKSQLLQLLRENLKNSNRKAKKVKIRHKDIATIMSMIEKHSEENSESDELNSVSDDSASSSTVSSSSSGTTTSSAVSSDKEIKSSDDTDISSLSDNSEESSLIRIMSEMKRVLLILVDSVRIICRTERELLKGRSGAASNRSNSVIKGISHVTSKLENIIYQYNRRLKGRSIPKTAAQQRMTSKHERKTSRKCLSKRLVIQKKNRRNERDIMKAKHCLRNSVMFSNQVGSEEDISNDETAEGRLFTSTAKNLGIRLESGAYLKQLQLRKNILKKFPLPADVFDLNCQLPDKTHKQHTLKSMVRSDHCKKGKKKK